MARRRTKTTGMDERAGESIVKTTTSAPEHVQPRPLLQETVCRSATDDTRTRIEMLAYELYQQRGCRDGHDQEDWLEAERLALEQQTGASKNGNGVLGGENPYTPTDHGA
jgi:DUF2934 family protein